MPVMITQPYHLYVERRDDARNMARFYALEITPTLLGAACLRRTWGRIGSRGQVRLEHFDREEEAVEQFLALTRAKRQRGYRPRYPQPPRPSEIAS